MAECPIWIGDPAVNMVSLAYNKYTQFATESYRLATDQIRDLDHFDITPVSFGVHFDVDDAIYAYQRPRAPDEPDGLEFRSPGTLPDAPAISLDRVNLDAAPKAPSNPAPVIREFADPGPLRATPPPDDVRLQPVPTATRPDIELPSVPTLEELHLPDAPDITFETFAGTRPDTRLEPPVETFAFTPERYTSDLLERVKGRVGAMMDGGTGLPANVAQALRDRAYVALDASEMRAVQQAVEEFSARGFAEPNGVLAKRLAEVRQNNQNQRNALSRDIYIKEEETALENLRFAVTQGIALESTLMQQHTEAMRLGLAAAQAAQDVRIRVFDARVSLANLDLQAYQTDAQVWRETVQTELSKLEAYRTELEGERVRGQINEQRVRIYNQRLEGLNTLVEMYKADISAATAVAQQNQSIVAVQRARVESYGAQVDAYKSEWDAYRAKLESNSTRAQLYGLIEQGYSTRVGAWSQEQQQKLRAQELHISENELSLKAWQTQRDKMLADLEAEKTRLAAISDTYRARTSVYQAKASVEAVASDANLRKLNVRIESEKARVDTALKNADIAINQMVEVDKLLLAKMQGITQTSSQLAAASMSAVNFSAGVHSGRSESQGCNTSFSYSGSLDDSTPP